MVFRLKFIDGDTGSAREIEFEAGDPSRALSIAHHEAPGQPAELWQDNRLLCIIEERGAMRDVWHIG